MGKKNKNDVWKELKAVLDECDKRSVIRCKNYLQEAFNNIEGSVRYFKIDLKNGLITHADPIVRPYFTEIAKKKPDRNPEEYIMAHNGWTGKTQDFGKADSFHYLRRLINIWDDSVKLFYGDKKEDSPYLWEHMEKYIRYMATIFQGLRIDNCHSTPKNVLEYYVAYARTINSSLYIFAELFSGDAREDADCAKKLGLYALVRESMYVRFLSL